MEEQTRELQEEEGDSETRDTMMTIMSLGLDEAMSIHRELVELVRLDTVPWVHLEGTCAKMERMGTKLDGILVGVGLSPQRAGELPI